MSNIASHERGSLATSLPIFVKDGQMLVYGKAPYVDERQAMDIELTVLVVHRNGCDDAFVLPLWID